MRLGMGQKCVKLCAKQVPNQFMYHPSHEKDNARERLTCRLMKLDVVSEEVLPSERLKRLLRFGNFLGNCRDGKRTGSEFNHLLTGLLHSGI